MQALPLGLRQIAHLAAVALTLLVLQPNAAHADEQRDLQLEKEAREKAAREEQQAQEDAELENQKAQRRAELAERTRTRWGVGIRTRYNALPAGLLEGLFFERAGGLARPGIAAELVRRRRNLDIVIGLQYDDLRASEGYYLDKGNDAGTIGEYPDYVTFDNFGMLGADLTFIWNLALSDMIRFRYGAGLGVAVVVGDIMKEEAICVAGTTPSDLDDRNTTRCTRQPATKHAEEDIPPVVPIVHLLTGLRFDLADDLSLSFDVGFRDVFFGGLGATYLFW